MLTQHVCYCTQCKCCVGIIEISKGDIVTCKCIVLTVLPMCYSVLTQNCLNTTFLGTHHVNTAHLLLHPMQVLCWHYRNFKRWYCNLCVVLIVLPMCYSVLTQNCFNTTFLGTHHVNTARLLLHPMQVLCWHHRNFKRWYCNLCVVLTVLPMCYSVLTQNCINTTFLGTKRKHQCVVLTVLPMCYSMLTQNCINTTFLGTHHVNTAHLLLYPTHGYIDHL